MEYERELNFTQWWKNDVVATCIVDIKESLQELKPYTMTDCWKQHLSPVGNDARTNSNIN